MDSITHPTQPADLFSIIRDYGETLPADARRTVTRGDTLMREGEPSDSLFLIESGRLQVVRGGVELAELGTGVTAGEIGLITGEARTADVIAARDSVVVKVTQDDYDAMVARHPTLPQAIARLMAQRLANTSAKVRAKPEPPAARTLAVLPVGDGDLPQDMLAALNDALNARASAQIVRPSDAAHLQDLDGLDAAGWFNGFEKSGTPVLFIGDRNAPDWTRRILRQADQVLLIGTAGAPPPLSELERFAFDALPESHRRLVLIHPEKRDWVSGTEDWLDSRAVFMHHHVALSDPESIARLARFLTGRARGIVAAGGGALGPLHTGIFQGFRDAGITFDIFGGTSVGSAMVGAFAMGLDGDEIDRRTGEIFVRGKALAKLTVPKYSLMDHKVFDHHLAKHYTTGLIENLWYPYFALATDLSANDKYLIRRGPLWRAIRASSAIPGVVPPVYLDGHMLADGGSMDNLPYRTMHAMKSGPNLIINFGREGFKRYDVDYDALPGRGAILKRMLWPFGRRLPRAPGIMPVLMRSLVARQAADPMDLGPEDWLVRPPVPDGVGFMDWSAHRRLFDTGRAFAAELLAERPLPDDGRAAFLDG